MKVYTWPTMESAIDTWKNGGGGPAHHVINKTQALAARDWETVNDRADADVIHVHGPATLNGGEILTIQAIWPTHIYPTAPAWWHEQNETMRQAMLQASVVIAQTLYTAELCQRLAGVDVRIIPQAINPDEWDLRNLRGNDWRHELGIPAEYPIVLWAKNQADQLRDPRPAVELARARPDLCVVMTADRDAVTAYAGPPTENVFCTGQLPFFAYQDLLRSCDVFLSTTIESSGQAHLEALYLGIPVLGYAWGGGIADMLPVGSGGAGELVPPGEIDQLIDAFDTVYSRRRSYGQAGRQLVSKNYTWPAIVDLLINIYMEVHEHGNKSI